MKNIINRKTLGVVLVFLLVILMLFSKTIYFYNIPTVTIVLPENGKIVKKEDSTGVAKWENMEHVYAEVRGKVEQIHVSEGDQAVEGQPLFTMSYDEQAIYDRLATLALDKKQLALDVENIHQRIEKLKRDITREEEETIDRDEVSFYELSRLEDRVNKTQSNYDKQSILFEAGIIPKSDYDNALDELASARAEYEEKQESMRRDAEKTAKNEEAELKAKEKRIEDWNEEIKSLEQSLKGKNITQQNYALEENSLGKELQEFKDNITIFAGSTGFVDKIPINKGQTIEANTVMASIGLGENLLISAEISENNKFITVGDECYLSDARETIKGTVSQLTTVDNKRTAIIKINSEEVSAGENFTVKFQKEYEEKKTIVPNGAVNRDTDGNFLYQINERDGILGKEYYAQKLRVIVGESDDENTVIEKGITFFEPIVLLTTKPFEDGATVQIKNEGDLIVDK